MRVITNVDIKYMQLDAYVRFWEDGEVNGVDDDPESPKMPFAEKSLVRSGNPWKPNEKVEGYKWKPKIDIDHGVIVNWPVDVEAKVHYKVCDECHYSLIDDHGNIIFENESYVPSVLCIGERNGGDYIIMNINKSGEIENWEKNRIKEIIERNSYEY